MVQMFGNDGHSGTDPPIEQADSSAVLINIDPTHEATSLPHDMITYTVHDSTVITQPPSASMFMPSNTLHATDLSMLKPLPEHILHVSGNVDINSMFHISTSDQINIVHPPTISNDILSPSTQPELPYTTDMPETSTNPFNVQSHIIENVPYNESIMFDTQKNITANNNLNNSTNNFPYTLIGDAAKDNYTELTRARFDSTSSEDTLSSASSGEIFNSEYVDTVSSVDSTTYLMKNSDDQEEKTLQEPVKEIYFNTGYETYSSSEQLDSEAEEEKPNSGANAVDQPLLNDDESADIVGDSDNDYNGQGGIEKSLSLLDFLPHHLIPLTENAMITEFTVEEVEPSQYTQITDHITVVDESFLFQSQTSLWDTDNPKQGKLAGTMQNIHERLSFIDLTEISKVGRACQKALVYLKDDATFGSMASLNNAAAKQGFNEKDPSQGISLIGDDKEMKIIPSTRHTRNLIALSLCLTLLFIAIGSVRNLQSSLNHEGGVGVISMAVVFIGYTVGSIFSASIVQNFQPRTCIIISLVPNLLYIASNLYPVMWLMVPMSFVQGVTTAIIWNAMTTYITFLAKGRALKKKESLEQVSSRFFGLFCLIFQSNIIFGNLIASLVLMFGNSPASSALSPNSTVLNSTVQSDSIIYMLDNSSLSSVVAPNNLSICGAKFCNHFDMGGNGVHVSDVTKYTLFGIYFGCVLLAMVIAVFMLEPLNARLFTSTMPVLQKTKAQLVSLAKFSLDWKFLLMLPLSMYATMQYGFVSAEVTKAFVTCPLGIHMVGYTMICLGVCGSLSSYLCGLLNKYTGRIIPIITAATLNLGVLVYMTQWQPSPDSLIPYFVVMGVWGISDGIWISQVNILMGSVFPDKYEEAFAGLRIAQGLSVAISFGYSSSLCMTAKIYILGGFCLISVVAYILMEVLLRRRVCQKVVTLKQTSV